MEWIQTLTIIGVLGMFMIYITNKLDKIEEKINIYDKRTDQLYHLYQVIVNLLKEKK